MIEDFEEAKSLYADTLSFSESILDPVIRIESREEGFVCKLYGKRVWRGVSTLIAAESILHNWVLDSGVARPLPTEAISELRQRIGLSGSGEVGFKEIVKIEREPIDWFTVEIDPNVWQVTRPESLAFPDFITGLNANLYPYQKAGVAWMQHTLRSRGGLVLADEMGLGKTLQLIATLLAFNLGSPIRGLIVCPTSLLVNWQREIHRFAPNVTVLIHTGPRRAGIAAQLSDVDLILTTYDTVVQDELLLKSMPWNWIICDEAQAVKNPHSKRRRALSNLRGQYLIPVTGTPVETSLSDLWSLLDLAIEGVLGSLDEFEETYQDDIESASRLSQYVDALILRRRVSDVAKDLPERFDIEVPVELSAKDAALYEEVRKDALAEFEQSGALVASTRLELMVAHPWILEHEAESDFWQMVTYDRLISDGGALNAKLQRTQELLEEAFVCGNKVLLFARFNRVFPIVKALTSREQKLYLNQINGETEAVRRQEIVDEFTEHTGPALLVLNPKAAAAGLNITAATVVIHFTQYWNPALDMQASARAHRRGQERPVTIYRIYFVNTLEEVMLERAAQRREMGDAILDPHALETQDVERALQLSPVMASQ